MTLETLVDSTKQLVAVVVLLIISGGISASETALFALTRRQLQLFQQSDRWTAQLVLRLRETPRSMLATILLSNITVNTLLYSILAVTVGRVAGHSPLAGAALGAAAFVLVLFCAEVIPKLVAFSVSERLAPLVAVPIRLLEIVTWPIRWVLGLLLVEPLTRILGAGRAVEPHLRAEELQHLVNICQAEGLIDERENALLHRLMDLADMRVSELMIPRVDVVAFDLADDRTRLVELIAKHRLLRIPAYADNVDNIKGVISSKECLLNPHRKPAELLRPARFIPEQARVEALLHHFRTTGAKQALVVDEYGGLAGIVALEDIVEEIVGEIHAPDEPRSAPGLMRLGETTFIVEAGLSIDDFCRAFRLPVEETRVNTVGGLIGALLERVPHPGDHVDFGGARLTVLNMKKHRILQVHLTLPGPVEDNPDLRRFLRETTREGAAGESGPWGAMA
jgi:putative hemolysin